MLNSLLLQKILTVKPVKIVEILRSEVKRVRSPREMSHLKPFLEMPEILILLDKKM
jgi:hypothetical protein